MTATGSTVTVIGPDRSGLLATLTVRFGKVDVVGERQVTLPDGSAGWELVVRHESFTKAPGNGGGPSGAAGAPAAVTALRDEMGTLRQALAVARAEAGHGRADASAARDEAEALRVEASAARNEAETLRAEASAVTSATQAERATLSAEHDQLRAQRDAARNGQAQAEQERDAARAGARAEIAAARQRSEDELAAARAELAREHDAATGAQELAAQRVTALERAAERERSQALADAQRIRDAAARQVGDLLARRDEEAGEALALELGRAQEEGRAHVAAATTRAADLKQRSEAELAAARADARDQLRAAREQAAALLAAARAEADAALSEGRALGTELGDAVERVRGLGRQIEAEVVAAHRRVTARTQLSAVQAVSRAEQPDLDAAATTIAAQVVRILSEAPREPERGGEA